MSSEKRIGRGWKDDLNEATSFPSVVRHRVRPLDSNQELRLPVIPSAVRLSRRRFFRFAIWNIQRENLSMMRGVHNICIIGNISIYNSRPRLGISWCQYKHTQCKLILIDSGYWFIVICFFLILILGILALLFCYVVVLLCCCSVVLLCCCVVVLLWVYFFLFFLILFYFLLLWWHYTCLLNNLFNLYIYVLQLRYIWPLRSEMPKYGIIRGIKP